MPPVAAKTVDAHLVLAAETTLLAWLRTGLSMIGLGFVVSKFGLFVELMSRQSTGAVTTEPFLTSGLSVALVLCGSLAILLPSLRYRNWSARLQEAEVPGIYSTAFAVWISIAVSVCGLLLAAYLVVTS